VRKRGKMPEIREEDMRETISIPMRPIVPAIPTNDKDLRQVGEDLRKMGCDGLLAQPWNVQDDKVLREFKFPRGTGGCVPRGGSRKNGLRVRGLRFTDSIKELEKGGQAGKMAYSSENSKERWTQRKDCTPPTARMRESGGCWSS
jgi:hypothetical protein